MTDILQKHKMIVVTLGHVDHGKTTFFSSLTAIFAKRFPDLNKYLTYNTIQHTPMEIDKGVTINLFTCKLETPNLFINFIDAPGHADYINNMITGTQYVDKAIVVVDLGDGVMIQTKTHFTLAIKLNVSEVIFFVNKMDQYDHETIEDLKEDAEEQLKSLAKDQGYTGKLTFFYGSALRSLEILNGNEKISQLIHYNQTQPGHVHDNVVKYFADLDAAAGQAGSDELTQNKKDALYHMDGLCKIMDYFESPEMIVKLEERNKKPFVFCIESTNQIKGIGTIVVGKVVQGTINVKDEVDLIGGIFTEPKKTAIKSMETHRTPLAVARSGDSIGILMDFKNITDGEKEEITKGMFLCAPGALKSYRAFDISFEFFNLIDKSDLESTSKINIIKSFNEGFKPVWFTSSGKPTTGTIISMDNFDKDKKLCEELMHKDTKYFIKNRDKLFRFDRPEKGASTKFYKAKLIMDKPVVWVPEVTRYAIAMESNLMVGYGQIIKAIDKL